MSAARLLGADRLDVVGELLRGGDVLFGEHVALADVVEDSQGLGFEKFDEGRRLDQAGEGRSVHRDSGGTAHLQRGGSPRNGFGSCGTGPCHLCTPGRGSFVIDTVGTDAMLGWL
ncbi:hypothetical protein [Actinomadura sediminis]|uniref:Uncharacterized protein n=1 Tax=Actinomadura sediminis TaxID=1038904 RepID=A0ABW3EIA1_9ACTN